jgi:hypothetical protein
MKNFLILLAFLTFFSCKKEDDVVPVASKLSVNSTDNTVSIIGTYYAKWPISGGYMWKYHTPVFKIDNNTVQVDSASNNAMGFKMVFAKETSTQVLFTIPTQRISYISNGYTKVHKVTSISDTVYFNKTSKVFTCSYTDSTGNGTSNYNLTMTKD